MKSEAFPAQSCMHPSFLIGTTPNTPPVLLTLSWHLLPRGSPIEVSRPEAMDPGDSNGVRRSERRQEGKVSERVNRFNRSLGEDRSQGSTKILGFRNLEGWSYHCTDWAAWGRSRCVGEEVMTMRSLASTQVMFGTTISHLKRESTNADAVSLKLGLDVWNQESITSRGEEPQD